MSDIFRVYLDPAEIAPEGHAHAGYPWAWFRDTETTIVIDGTEATKTIFPIKDLIRLRDGHRCLRCKHPYTKGDGEWSRCDEQCTHGGPIAMIEERLAYSGVPFVHVDDPKMTPPQALARITPRIEGTDLAPALVVARWRILTVHHLNGVKHDCRWWNLVSLCQRCHLLIQAKVHMQTRYSREHSEWFKPFVAGYYAWAFLGLELTEDETRARLDELLALEDRQLSIEEA